MSPLIRDVVSAARKTFSAIAGDHKDECLHVLKSLLSRLKASDMSLTEKELEFSRWFSFQPPVRFMSVHEESNFTVTVFILPGGRKIPLHDHPKMNGLMKCLSGRIRVTSYSPLATDQPITLPASIAGRIPASSTDLLIPCFRQESVVNSDDETVLCLTPDRGNIHEVEAVASSSAFLDVLSPPYSDDTSCNYYEVIGHVMDQRLQREVSWLYPLRHSPPDYFTEFVKYRGPDVE